MACEDSLVQAAVAGDEDALTTLLEQCGVAVREGLSINPQWRAVLDPDDVMQVTYLEAFLRIRTLQHPSPAGFAAWLRRIAENNLRDAVRWLERDKRNQPRPPPATNDDSYTSLLGQLPAGSTTPSRSAGRREVQQFVDDALRRLPHDYERVIRLCELESKTAPEAASIMGRSHGAIRMLLARAMERLHEVIVAAGSAYGDTA